MRARRPRRRSRGHGGARRTPWRWRGAGRSIRSACSCSSTWCEMRRHRGEDVGDAAHRSARRDTRPTSSSGGSSPRRILETRVMRRPGVARPAFRRRCVSTSRRGAGLRSAGSSASSPTRREVYACFVSAGTTMRPTPTVRASRSIPPTSDMPPSAHVALGRRARPAPMSRHDDAGRLICWRRLLPPRAGNGLAMRSELFRRSATAQVRSPEPSSCRSPGDARATAAVGGMHLLWSRTPIVLARAWPGCRIRRLARATEAAWRASEAGPHRLARTG